MRGWLCLAATASDGPKSGGHDHDSEGERNDR
jgi:hypothetical protein